MTDIVYSLNGEEFLHDSFEEAVFDQLQDMDFSVVEAGERCHVYQGIKVSSKPSDQLYLCDLNNIIEKLTCRANNIGGEWADGWTYDIGYKAKDLLIVISKWLDDNAPFNFYGVTDVEPVYFTITQAMIDEVTA